MTKRRAFLPTAAFLLVVLFLSGCAGLPESLQFKEKGVLKGHAGQVLSVDIHPDGRHIASASADRTVRVWDIVDPADPRVLENFDGRVMSVCFSPSGRYLAAGTEDRYVKIYDTETWRPVHEMKNHTLAVYDLAWTPDEKYLASCAKDFTIRLWDVETGKLVHVFRGHRAAVNSIVISHDGKYLVSGSRDKRIVIWSIADKKPLMELPTNDTEVYALALSPDGSMLAASTAVEKEGIIKDPEGLYPIFIYKRMENDEIVRTAKLKGQAALTWGLTFDESGRYLISSGNDDKIAFWDLESGLRGGYHYQRYGNVWAIDLAPNGSFLAAACADNAVLIFGR